MLINVLRAVPFDYAYSRQTLAPDTLRPQKDTVITRTDTLSDDGEPVEAKIDYQAEDSIRMDAENKKVYLYGQAEVHYEDMNLKAARIEIDNKTNLITAYGVPDSTGKLVGNPDFSDAGNKMTCEKIVYNSKTKKGKITGILTQQNQMYIHGEAVKKDTNNVMYMRNIRCIPCEFADGRVYFKANKGKVIPNDKIVTGPMFVEISEVPTPLGLPFGFFPNVSKNKGKAGIIMPYVGNSASQGFYLQNLGFFMPVNNKVQLFLFANLYTNGSWAINTTNPDPMLMYKVNYKYTGSLNIGYSENVSGRPEDRNPIKGDLNGFTKAKNLSISWQHMQDNRYDPTIRFSALVNFRTSGFGKYNNQVASNYLNNSFNSNIAFTKTFKGSYVSVNGAMNQNTSTGDVQVNAPQLTYAINTFYPFKNPAHSRQNLLDKFYLNYTFQTQATIKTKDSLLLKPTTLDSIQKGMVHKIPIGTNISLLKYFTLSPSANFTGYTYFNSKQLQFVNDTLRSFNRQTPGFMYDASYQANLTTKIYGDYLFKSKLLKQIRHQIIPTVGFVYHPNMENNKYGGYSTYKDTLNREIKYQQYQNGIYGSTAGAESGNITFNINNTLDAKVRKKTDTSISYQKVSLLQMLSIGGSYNVAAKTNNLSLISIGARNSFFKNAIGVQFNSTFDPYADSMGVRTNHFQYEKNGQLAHFTQCILAINGNFTNAMVASMKNSKTPWTIGVNYSYTYTKGTGSTPSSLSQNLRLNASFMPTINWRFNVNTYFNLKTNAFENTQFTITRDLRCWMASINWIPIGGNKQYSATLSLKVQALQDLKIPKQKLWQDNL